ncbi:MAG: hypothetical protein ACFB4I_21860 [Cyanophyceae cyanobacterium]
MEVSTFELTVKPTDCQDSNASTQPFRQIIQGYALTIANREPRDITFQLEIFLSPSSLGAMEVDPYRNLELLVNLDGDAQKVSLMTGPLFGPNRCLGLFRIPASRTAVVQLVPKTLPEPLVAETWSARGYTVLRVPQLPFCSRPQSDTPIEVQLKPETRRVLQNELGFEQGFEVRCPLALASDRACNEIEAEAGCFAASASSCPDNETIISYLLRKIENFELSDSDLLALAGDNQEKVLEIVEMASELDFAADEIGELWAELDAVESVA